MNLSDLVEVTNNLKSMEIKLSKEQEAELLEVVNILETSSNSLFDLSYSTNRIIAEHNITLFDDVKKLDYLTNPTFTELKNHLESLKVTLGLINLEKLQTLINRLILVERSVLQTLAYLKTLDYVFEDKPKIILLN